MTYKMLIMLLIMCGSLFAADVFEDFESYTDTADLRAVDEIYTPVTYGSDPNSPDEGRAQIYLNTSDPHGGSKCLETYIGTYETNRRDWGFKAPDSNFPWDWSGYEVLRFYYKGDIDLRVRIYNQYIPGIVYEETFSKTETDEWIPVVINISDISTDQVQLLLFSMYDRNNQGVEVMFDDFELIETAMFQGSSNVYYPGNPNQMTVNWSVSDPNVTPTLSYGIGGYDNQVSVSGSLDFSYTVDDLIPSKPYIYQIEAGGFTKEGRFAAENFPQETYIVEDYESYADVAALEAEPQTYYPATYGSSVTLYLEEGYDGAQSARFKYSGGWGTSVMFGLELNGAYLMGYDKLRIWYKGDPTNKISGDNPREVTFRIQQDADKFAVKNVGKVVAQDYWDYVEFEIDNSSGSKWSHVTHIITRIDRPKYETINFSLDRIELVNELSEPDGDLDGDYAVKESDLKILAADWLTDNTSVAGSSAMLQDFEGGISEWSQYYNSTAPSTLSAITGSGAAEGSGALKWDYDVATSQGLVYAEILYTLDSPVNLSQYDRINIKVKRYLTNSEESSVYVKFLDGGLTNENLSGKAYLDGATVADDEHWQTWSVDLHNLNYEDGEPTYTQLSDITNVQGLMFGVIGSQGTGTIDMDSIELVNDPQCSVEVDTDFNSDCVINLLDFEIIASNWLLDYTVN